MVPHSQQNTESLPVSLINPVKPLQVVSRFVRKSVQGS